MKLTIHDENEHFSLNIDPETMAEAALLVRLGLNATKELRAVDTTAYRDGTFSTWIVIGQRKQSNGTVKP